MLPSPRLPLLVWLLTWPAATLVAQEARPVRGYLNDSTLAFMRPLIGHWRPVIVYGASPGDTTTIVAEAYRWTVGGKAIHYLENYPLGQPDSAQVDGMVYWNPAAERVEFVGVAGRGPGQGRLYQGEYRELDDGTIERVFDGYYRTLADIPAETLGGFHRRYRQRFRFVTPDSLEYQLDWFHDGAWRPFGRFARNALVRIPGRASVPNGR